MSPGRLSLEVRLCLYLFEAGDAVDYRDLVDLFSGESRKPETVEQAIWELCRFGALERVGRARHFASGHVDSRGVRLTTLGRCWLESRRFPVTTSSAMPPAAVRLPFVLASEDSTSG